MVEHVFLVNGQKITGEKIIIPSGNANTDALAPTFSEEWDGLVIYAAFMRGGHAYQMRANDEGKFVIPAAIAENAGRFKFGFVGFTIDSEGHLTMRISTQAQYGLIGEGTYSGDGEILDPTIWEELVAHLDDCENPHMVTAAQTGANTKEQTNELLSEKVDKAGDTMTGDLIIQGLNEMSRIVFEANAQTIKTGLADNLKVKNLATPTSDSDAATKKYVDDGLAVKANTADVNAALDTKADADAMTAALEKKFNRSGGTITGNATVNGELLAKQGVIVGRSSNRSVLIDTENGLTISRHSKNPNDPYLQVKTLADPVEDRDAATKKYVDDGLKEKANTSDMTAALNTKANADDVTAELEKKFDKKGGTITGPIEMTRYSKIESGEVVRKNPSVTVPPDADAKLELIGNGVKFCGFFEQGNHIDIDGASGKITGIGAPSNDTDAVPKKYVDEGLAEKANASDMTAALAMKADAAAVNAALDTKALASEVYTKSQTDALLRAKADETYAYSKAETNTLLSEKANASDVTAALAAKANASAVYTKSETDTKLGGKLNTSGGTVSGNLTVTGKVVEGYQTEASGAYSHAEGYKVKATGVAAHAEGIYNDQYEQRIPTASGQAAHIEGRANIAAGNFSHAEGDWTTANGEGSHTEGYWNEAIEEAKYAHVSGEGNLATARAQTVIGKYNDTNDDALFIVGNGTGYDDADRSNAFLVKGNGTAVLAGDLTFGNDSTSLQSALRGKLNTSGGTVSGDLTITGKVKEGEATAASGKSSHAEGYQTEATDDNAHAEGYRSKANGKHSHAEGSWNEANGDGAHAEGYWNYANGTYSHAGGEGNYAKARSQTVIGKYNADDNDALFIVGNGVYHSSSNIDRANAFKVMSNGDIVVSGGIKLKDTVTGTVYTLTIANGQIVIA